MSAVSCCVLGLLALLWRSVTLCGTLEWVGAALGGFAGAPGVQELLVSWLRVPAGPMEKAIHGALAIPSPEGIPSGVQ